MEFLGLAILFYNDFIKKYNYLPLFSSYCTMFSFKYRVFKPRVCHSKVFILKIGLKKHSIDW